MPHRAHSRKWGLNPECTEKRDKDQAGASFCLSASRVPRLHPSSPGASWGPVAGIGRKEGLPVPERTVIRVPLRPIPGQSRGFQRMSAARVDPPASPRQQPLLRGLHTPAQGTQGLGALEIRIEGSNTPAWGRAAWSREPRSTCSIWRGTQPAASSTCTPHPPRLGWAPERKLQGRKRPRPSWTPCQGTGSECWKQTPGMAYQILTSFICL